MIKNFFKNSFSKALNNSATNNRTTNSVDSGSQKGSQDFLSAQSLATRLYHRLSGDALSLSVKPQLVGEVPELANTADSLTFYVLKEYSRSNSVLLNLQTQACHLPEALASVQSVPYQIDEKTAVIFLNHRNATKNALSPKLLRLIKKLRQFADLKIQLVPVTIVWGRAPEKEDSLFKLLMADNWQEPTLVKQLFNIGVMGRDTFVQFHAPIGLQDLIRQVSADKVDQADVQDLSQKALITEETATAGVARAVVHFLNQFLDKQRASILGPDLSDRRNVVDKLLFAPSIRQAIEKQSAETGESKEALTRQARQYLNEITSDYSYPVVRFFDKFLTWLWTQLYDGVKVQHFERVRELAADYEIVYVPCHRSHIDYLLLSYVIYRQGLSIPYIAAGDNLNIPILGQILRNGGAFFMRRSFRDNPLYSVVFKEYLHSILQRNAPLEYFIEGGRSRTGRLLPPKMGMLSMTVNSHLRGGSGKPIVFIPTYIGYERIMEGGTYIGELKGKPKESETLLGLLKTTRKIERIFGTVHLSFGMPLHLSHFLEKFSVGQSVEQSVEQSDGKNSADQSLKSDPPDPKTDPEDLAITAMVENIGVKIMQHINRTAVINPVSLLSLVLLSTPKAALDEESCREQIALYQRLATQLPYDEDVSVTDLAPQEIIDYGIRLKLIERRAHLLGDMIQVADNQAPLLSYFRNNILHAFILPSFVTALVQKNGRISRSAMDNVIGQLYPFLQAELFLKYPLRKIVQTVDDILKTLVDQGLVIELDAKSLGAPQNNGKKYQQLSVLSVAVEQSLERYFLTVAVLAQQGSDQLTLEEVVDLCYLLGQRLSVLYADDIPDFFDRALFTSFIKTLIRLDYVQADGKTGRLSFDHRIHDIANNARFILNDDMMTILKHIADLDKSEIDRAISELKQKNAKKFRKKR